MMPITPPPAAPQSILHLKSSMEESDSFHSHNFDNQTTYSMRIAETSTQSSVDFQGNNSIWFFKREFGRLSS
jgi:hypothetical protein